MRNWFLLKIIFVVILLGGSALTSVYATNKVLPATASSEKGGSKKVKPLFKDFMGINGHFHFKPDLYSQLCRLVRNYHSVRWDVENPGGDITLPICTNLVNWETQVYAPWKEKGFETDICIQFLGLTPPERDYESFWQGQEDWAYRYGKAMASFFGPSGEKKLCTSMEVGNEPGGRFDIPLFKTIFSNIAQGIRDGDRAMKILTPTVQAREGDDYSQDLNSIYKDEDILPLYDVINVHVYASIPESAPGKSPWNRTFPEDSATDYLKVVDETVEWRPNLVTMPVRPRQWTNEQDGHCHSIGKELATYNRRNISSVVFSFLPNAISTGHIFITTMMKTNQAYMLRGD